MKRKNKQKNLPKIIFGITIILIIFLLVILYLKKQQKITLSSNITPTKIIPSVTQLIKKEKFIITSDIPNLSHNSQNITADWNTYENYFVSFRYPKNWQENGANFYYWPTKIENHYCPAYPGEIIGLITEQLLSSPITEKAYYDINSTWGGESKINGNGGTGKVSQRLVLLGGKPALETKTTWVDGYECFFENKPRVDLEYHIYVDDDYPNQILLRFFYFPADQDSQKTIEAILSTFNFNF